MRRCVVVLAVVLASASDAAAETCQEVRSKAMLAAQDIVDAQERGRYLMSIPECAPDGRAAPTSTRSDDDGFKLCVEGRRRPRCSAIFLLELSARGGNLSSLSIDTGFVANTRGNHAFGVVGGVMVVTAGFPTSATNASFGYVELRYRHWLSEDAALDLGVAGALDFDQRPGAMIVAALGGYDAIALTASIDALPVGAGYALGANIGLRIGAKPIVYAAYAAGVALYGVACVAAAFSARGGC